MKRPFFRGCRRAFTSSVFKGALALPLGALMPQVRAQSRSDAHQYPSQQPERKDAPRSTDAVMTEHNLILKTPVPRTRSSLARQLAEGGVTAGSTILVHSSLSSLGWVAGGAVAVIQALMDCIGPNGTLVMPTHTAHLTDPAEWEAPPVPSNWVETLREEMPAYDPATTPTRNMGAVAELFRTWPGARRSLHPTCSFAAIGPRADQIIADHALESPLGERSPLAKLYDVDASVLLLGVDFDVCTLLHLAEQRAWPNRPKTREGSPVLENGVRRWAVYETPALLDSEHFLPMGRALKNRGAVKTFSIGNARSMLFSGREAVDFAIQTWRGQLPPA
ncbi:aminoglycoside N(3)-acetyltransferase [Mycetohabitans sp. B8]|uniref:aminoglycoside N(3)-acetyltransferase n=1 Tax=Mycetohabitans sp. B8 TaxID=2841845 RepID=UPI001F2AAA09|nr:AAC(3) family N-acetyltransferase [Mycetohabitans sp. B8]